MRVRSAPSSACAEFEWGSPKSFFDLRNHFFFIHRLFYNFVMAVQAYFRFCSVSFKMGLITRVVTLENTFTFVFFLLSRSSRFPRIALTQCACQYWLGYCIIVHESLFVSGGSVHWFKIHGFKDQDPWPVQNSVVPLQQFCTLLQHARVAQCQNSLLLTATDIAWSVLIPLRPH